MDVEKKSKQGHSFHIYTMVLLSYLALRITCGAGNITHAMWLTCPIKGRYVW